ncbi:LysM peptidoglycan-binding domain-containing protein [Paucihalobacter ruber]|uniref:LysM peptidoglycan-binding domain-containing protein n=1 Tax=Paucihalobacter ruber TaxID=2567861 RepID=A0A506PP71_9FLAO|nr:LysM peptidoglycan-binding domain-containing protein [Paucihalobacter ruber]TPV35504.1 LysM peptidoglycan-binding domain-containing protein [Paucihalobacter ruber]
MGFKSLIVNCIVWLLFSAATLHGQNSTIQHTVKKGENVYRLSLKYGVSINDIYRLNPDARDYIKTGEILLIPTNTTSQNASEDTAVNGVYTVKRGETKFGLSKKFGVSISELENANPFIKNGLQAGHRLKIPNGSNQTETAVSNADGSHKVLKGETLWGISRLYNMSLDELKKINNFKTGQILLEGEVLLVDNKQNITNNNTYTVLKGDTKYGLSKKFNTTVGELERLNPSIVSMLKAGDVIVFESLKNEIKITKSEEDLSIESEEKEIEADDNWYVIKPKETLYSLSKKTNMSIDELTTINPKLKQAVLAGDSIKIKNSIPDKINETLAATELEGRFQTNIFWYHPESESGENISKNNNDYYTGIKNAISNISSGLDKVKVITNSSFDPTSDNLGTKTDEIFHIIPQPKFNNNIADLGNFEFRFFENSSPQTKMIKSLVSDSQMRIKMLSFLNSTKANIICVYDDENSDNIPLIENSIPSIKLMKLNRNGSFKSNDLQNLLDSNRINYVIIESKKTGAYLNVSTLLLKELSKYNSQLAVLDQKNIPDESDVSIKRFKILKLMYPMAYNPNYIDSRNLINQIGYMVNYDVINRISSQGIKGFSKISEVLGSSFKYVIIGDTIQNTAVSIYTYGENSNAELLGTY